MIRWSANLSLLFREHPFPKRFRAAARAGFGAVEFLWPREVEDDLDELVEAKEAAGLEVALFNIDAGDIPAGDRGFAADPERRDWWRQRAGVAFELAGRLGARRLNALVGNERPGLSRQAMTLCLLENLGWALPRAEERGLTLLLEPLNRLESPAYLLYRTEMVAQILERLASPHLKLQLDVYHTARSGEDPLALLQAHAALLGHVQIADAPGRHQPGSGQMPWPELLGHLETLDYQGFVGLEYIPQGSTLESLAWLPPEGRRACRAADLRL